MAAARDVGDCHRPDCDASCQLPLSLQDTVVALSKSLPLGVGQHRRPREVAMSKGLHQHTLQAIDRL